MLIVCYRKMGEFGELIEINSISDVIKILTTRRNHQRHDVANRYNQLIRNSKGKKAKLMKVRET